MQATTFRDKTVAVFGLGTSGIATARALLDGGATVVAWDDGNKGRERAGAAGIPLGDLRNADWSKYAALVLAPGVPLTHPEPHWTVHKAHAAGVPIIGDVDLFFRELAASAPNAPVIAITGTNGKSTTTALIAHVLADHGCDVQMGGNIGRAVLTLEPPASNRVYVLEVSSYQIDLTPSLAPSVGVMLNLTPDHIDRHGTVDNYAAVKERLVAAAKYACVSVDDAYCQAMVSRRDGALTTFTAASTETAADVWVTDRTVHTRAGETLSLDSARNLRGAHNAQNAAATVAAIHALASTTPGLTLKTTSESITSAFESFPGLPHRMEEIAQTGPVLIINDSKATNADSAEKALSSFPGGIRWILGGVAKDGGIDLLTPYFDRVTKAYLIGEAAPAFAETLKGHVELAHFGSLEAATEAALADAFRATAHSPNTDAIAEVVLLSPACASFDQFPNFEMRGDAFRSVIEAELAKRGAQ